MSGIIVLAVVSVFVVLVFLGPWLSVINMKVLLLGSGSAAFIVLFVLPLFTSIHLP